MIEQEAYRRLKSKGLLSLPFFLYGIVPPVITQPAFPASSSGVSNLQRCQAAGYLTLAAVLLAGINQKLENYLILAKRC